ncbi:MAG: hypothetical protein K1X89_13620 [Myxococcaceae bacterium]|nr:hypothetical protein [Myxococcaceae bacterium]
MEPAPSVRDSQLTALDWMGALVAALGGLFCLQFPFFTAPSFKAMFADFGGQLPAITVLGLTPWFPLLVGAIPLAVLTFALAGKLGLGQRRAMIVGAFALSLGSGGLCVYAMYAPIVAIAGNIK